MLLKQSHRYVRLSITVNIRYELARKEKEASKKQKTVELKEVRLSPNIDTNDLNTKMNAARKFISKGNKVKVTLRFRGREMAHVQASKHILDDFAEALADIAVVEKAPKLEGRSIGMVLAEKEIMILRRNIIMPKMKTSRAAAKRFQINRNRKIKEK